MSTCKPKPRPRPKPKGILLMALAVLLTGALSLPAGAATYITPLVAKYEPPGGSAVIDTVITVGAAVTDTLGFGKVMDWAVIWTDASESARRKWVFWDPSGVAKLIQTKGTTPTNASKRKGRYNGLRYSSVFDTLNATGGEVSPISAPGALRAIIYGGVGSIVTVNIQAGTGAPPWASR